MYTNDMVLSGLLQMLIKRACDFVQYLLMMGHKLQKEHLIAKTLEHYAISYDAIKDVSKV